MQAQGLHAACNSSCMTFDLSRHAAAIYSWRTDLLANNNLRVGIDSPSPPAQQAASVCVCRRRPKVHVYYAAEGAFYAASVGMLLGWEERRRDFLVMLLHHVTTCALIAASYMLGCAALLLQCPAELLRNLATLQKLTTCALVAAAFPVFQFASVQWVCLVGLVAAAVRSCWPHAHRLVVLGHASCHGLRMLQEIRDTGATEMLLHDLSDVCERQRSRPAAHMSNPISLWNVPRTQGVCVRRYARIGSVVMLLHDPSDIFLEAAKLASYAGAEAPSTLCFAALLLTWCSLRLGLLPFWVIRSAMCALLSLPTPMTIGWGTEGRGVRLRCSYTALLLSRCCLRLGLLPFWVTRSVAVHLCHLEP